MLFTSLEFVFLFLPVVLAVNFILPRKIRNYWLMLASLFFMAGRERLHYGGILYKEETVDDEKIETVS